MNKHHSLYLIPLLLVFSNACSQIPKDSKASIDYVNPYIGNISHLLVPTFPTIHLPNSMMRVHPVRREITDNKLNGLPLFLPGHRGKQVFSINPYQGDSIYTGGVINYEYDNEEIKPYWYSVYLDNVETEVQYAPSHQSAVYEFNFKGKEQPSLLLSAFNGNLRLQENIISGYQHIGGKHNTKAYLYLEIQQKIDSSFVVKDNDSVSIVLKFPENQKRVNIRYGISLISEEQAGKNLRKEITDYDVARLAGIGRKKWIETLDKIEVKGEEKDKTVFYTALYRTYERMVCISEDGKYYSAFDGKVHDDNGIPFYTDDWFWDTYRATHPLRCILDPQKESDMINSILRIAGESENHWIPVFPGTAGDSHGMNCNHGIAVIIDGYRKGIKGFNLEKAYDAGKRALTEKTLAPWSRGQKAGLLDLFFKEKGYFPALNPNQQEYVKEVHSWERRQSVAVSLGTYYDEWCLAQLAKELGKSDDYEYFKKRSLNYRLLFNPNTLFFHPKNEGGNFIEAVDYRFSGGLGARDYYDENNGWIYRWDVQHNIADLIALMGDKNIFVREMESMFDTPLGKPKYEFYAILPDHTGNSGQYSMANEPSLHIPYLYNYAGQPWRTQKHIRNLLNQWFRDDYMGMPGDEDGGGMSAFVVFSQLGFYPVTPGLPMYVIGSPVFEKATIKLPGDKTFEIICHNYAPENKYIQSAIFNGKEWNNSWFSHDELMQGGTLQLNMGKHPNKNWASGEDATPPSFEMPGN